MNTDTPFLQGNFKGIQHLGIPVTDLETSVSFYSRLGFKRILASKVEVPEENDRILVAFMEQRGIVIELYQVTLPGQEGINHTEVMAMWTILHLTWKMWIKPLPN